jgi:hypothetical protein
LDADEKLLNHVRLDIFVPKDPKITFGEMQMAARANAIEVLKAALSTLKKHDIPALEEMGDETKSGHINTMFGGDALSKLLEMNLTRAALNGNEVQELDLEENTVAADD